MTWAAGPHTKEGAARAGACKRRRLQAPRGSASDMDAPPRDDKAGCEDDAAPLPPPPTPREDQEEEKGPLRRVDASGMGMLICRQQGPGADDGLITTIAVVDPGGAAHASGNFAAGDVLYNVASDACASMSGRPLASASSLACVARVAPVAPSRGAATAPLRCPCHTGRQCMDDHTLYAKMSGPAGTKVLLRTARDGSQHRQLLYLNPATDSMKLVFRCQGLTPPCAHSEMGFY